MNQPDKTIVYRLKRILYLLGIGLTVAISTFWLQHHNYDHLLATQANVANAADFEFVENFPLGWIDRIERPKTPGKVAQEGINFLIPYTHQNQYPQIKTYLDNAQKHGIKVFLEPYRESVETADLVAVTDFIRTYKDHPAVAGWYAYDEPAVTKKVSPKTLEATYRAIKAEDTKHPVAVVFSSSQTRQIPLYWQAMDICMVDRYPLFFGKPEFNNLRNFRQWMSKAAYAAGNKSFWPVLQGFGEQKNGKPKFKRRLPTATEEKYMFYTGILAGADATVFYGHHWTRQSWVDKVLTPIITEFKGFQATIAKSNILENPLVNRRDMQAVLYRDPISRKYLLIAIHHGKGNIKATISSRRLKAKNQIRVVGRNTSIKTKRGVFQDSFTSYGVNIYEIS